MFFLCNQYPLLIAMIISLKCNHTEGARGQLLPGSVIRHYRRGHLVLPGVLSGVTWSVTWCYLECYLVLPGCCLALPGCSSFWSSSFYGPKYPRSSNSDFWEKINFHLEMLPGPTPVVVTCLPGPPSAIIILIFFGAGLRPKPMMPELKS